MKNLLLLVLALGARSPVGSDPLGEQQMVSVGTYLGYYNIKAETDIAQLSNKIDSDTRDAFKAIEGSVDHIDTPEEFIVAAYFSPVRLVDAPALAAAEAMLPRSDLRVAGLKLGAMWYKKIVESRFCDPTNTAQLASYELAMRIVGERTGVSWEDMVAFFRNGINGVVAEAVERGFNLISFIIQKTSTVHYSATLMRNPHTGIYSLNYGGPFAGATGFKTKTISAASLNLLLAEMRRSRDGFDTVCVDKVRQQSKLIPAVAFDALRIRLPGMADGVALVTEALTIFYLNPAKDNFDVLIGIYCRGIKVWRTSDPHDPLALPVMESLTHSLSVLSPSLASTFNNEVLKSSFQVSALIPADPRYDIFSAPYGIISP